MELRQVTVRVPATAANLGPGFDCLGMALGLWNVVRLEVGKPGVSVVGEGSDTLSREDDNLILRAMHTLFYHVGVVPPTFGLHCKNTIPLARGLGSSAAAVVGGLVAANYLCGQPLEKDVLLQMAVSLEGHPDNVTPAMLGGLQIVAQDDGHLVTSRVRLPRQLSAVVFIPDVPMPSQEARAILPHELNWEQTIYNLGRVALLVNSLAMGKLDHLKVATQDALHQPTRQRVFQSMDRIIQAALAAGANGAFLSGAGSSVVALTLERHMTIGYEMAEAAQKSGVTGTFRVLRPTSRGCYVASKA